MSTVFDSILDLFPKSEGQAPGDIPSQAGNTANPLTQFVASLVIGLISITIFSILRVKWPAIYSSRTRLIRNPPPKPSDTFFGWVMPLIKLTEKEVLDLVGLDALMLLRFFKMSAKIFAICAIYGSFVLIPITSTRELLEGKEDPDVFDVTKRWSIIVVEPGSSFLIAHCVGVYLFSVITMFMLHREYQVFSDLRWSFLIKAKNSVTARSVMVEGIPRDLRSEPALLKYFDSISIGETETARVCHNTSELSKLVRWRSSSLRSLETTLASWLGNPCTYHGYDPESIRNAIEQKSLVTVGEKARPQTKSGFFGLVGPKVDAVSHRFNMFKDYDNAVYTLRNRDKKYLTTNTGFITFKSIRSAHIASQIEPNSTPFRLRTQLAPEPRDIYWSNLGITVIEKIIREVLVYICMLFVIFFWSVPIVFISQIFNLNSLVKTFPALGSLKDISATLWSLLSGFLPTVATITFLAITPLIFSALSVVQGNKSHSSIERHAISKHFLFLIINVLLVFTISNSVWKSVLDKVIKSPSDIPNLLASSLPSAAPFFVNYVMILGIGYFPLQLTFIGPVFTYLFRKAFTRTPRDYAELLQPTFTDYSWIYGQPLLVFVLATTFSVISPLILVVGAAYFFIGYFVSKYCLVYVYYRNYESGGLIWPMVFRRAMVGIFLLQILMAGYFSLREFFELSIAMVPLLIVTSVYSFYMPKAYPNGCKHLPANFLQDDPASREALIENSSYFDSQSQGATTASVGNNEHESSSLPVPKRQDVFRCGPLATGSTINVPSTLASDELMDDQQFMAEPDLRTDYHQSPMFKYPGILDSSICGYGNPAIHGSLPTLWLPQKVATTRLRKLMRKRTCFCCIPTTLRTDTEIETDNFESFGSEHRAHFSHNSATPLTN